MHYAIGDIHGCAHELELLLKQIAPKPNDTVVFLGDYIDRGPDSKGVIDIILDLKTKTNVVTLKGNHEQLFLDFLEAPQSPGAGVFVLNGGGATLASYPGPGGTFEIPESHIDFYYGLKTSYQTPTHFYVHAGVPNKPLTQLTPEDDMHLMWSRQPFLSSDYDWGKIIVHGHTPVNAPDIQSNRINLDTGCVYNGSLTALAVETGQIYQQKRDKQSTRVQIAIPTDENRVAVRFTGRLPVLITGDNGHSRLFETMNYNQFGLLMREIGPVVNEPALALHANVKGQIGPNGPSAIQFEGTVVRVEARSDMRLYGLSLEKVSNGNDGREWIERPPVTLNKP